MANCPTGFPPPCCDNLRSSTQSLKLSDLSTVTESDYLADVYVLEDTNDKILVPIAYYNRIKKDGKYHYSLSLPDQDTIGSYLNAENPLMVVQVLYDNNGKKRINVFRCKITDN